MQVRAQHGIGTFVRAGVERTVSHLAAADSRGVKPRVDPAFPSRRDDCLGGAITGKVAAVDNRSSLLCRECEGKVCAMLRGRSATMIRASA